MGTHRTNVDRSRDARLRLGDSIALPKVEDVIGRPRSRYAVAKHSNEFYTYVFARCYGLASIGLRWFNVFGPRQSSYRRRRPDSTLDGGDARGSDVHHQWRRGIVP